MHIFIKMRTEIKAYRQIQSKAQEMEKKGLEGYCGGDQIENGSKIEIFFSKKRNLAKVVREKNLFLGVEIPVGFQNYKNKFEEAEETEID